MSNKILVVEDEPRLREIVCDYFHSKGQDPVPAENIVGRVILVIPKIGGLVEFLRTPIGMTCLVLAGVILIELPSLTERIRAKKTGGSSHE